MARLVVMLVPLAFALIAAETAYYVPKSFYVIDQSGAVSAPVMLLGGRSLLRARRSALPGVSSASASSSSSSSGSGFGQSFSSSSSNTNSGFGYPDHGNGYQGSPYNGPQANVHSNPHLVEATLFNRFGDDGGVSGIGVSGTSTGGNGVFSGSSSTVDSDGKVHFSTHTGKF